MQKQQPSSIQNTEDQGFHNNKQKFRRQGRPERFQRRRYSIEDTDGDQKAQRWFYNHCAGIQSHGNLACQSMDMERSKYQLAEKEAGQIAWMPYMGIQNTTTASVISIEIAL